MDEYYEQTLHYLEGEFRIFESKVSAPVLINLAGGYIVRYKEKNIYQALVQKAARVISGLHAARFLLSRGFVQEVASLQRMIDEFNEDITFLASGIIYNKVEDIHRRYLDYFYQEEFDASGKPLSLTESRPMIPRKKIRSYLAKLMAPGIPDNAKIDTFKSLSKVYSGYVHGASPQIMDMCIGDPPTFHIRGMAGQINRPHPEGHALFEDYESGYGELLRVEGFGHTENIQGAANYSFSLGRLPKGKSSHLLIYTVGEPVDMTDLSISLKDKQKIDRRMIFKGLFFVVIPIIFVAIVIDIIKFTLNSKTNNVSNKDKPNNRLDGDRE